MAISPHPLLAVLLAAAPGFAPAQEETGLLRFPAIFGDQVVFTYAGDLFTVAAAGGVARRLTSDVGYEMFARFSPDGKSIAFTGQYDGNTEVFLMPALGGIPQRLTITATLSPDDVSDPAGPNNIVMAWKDNNTIVYRSRQREADDFAGQLFMVPREGGPSRQLPLPRGGFCSFAPDGRRLAYTRLFREFCTWKRYRERQADDIWIYDFDSKTTTNITNDPAQESFPMWAGTTVYFVSDRDKNKRMNLYAYDQGTRRVRALTSFTEFDVKFPSLGNTAIIFENGGFLYTLALETEQVRKLTITILEDFDNSRGGLRNVSSEITTLEIAPDGSRALFGARGDLFTVPEWNGNTRNLTDTPGVHERNPQWSPDGKWIAYIADGSGEDELYILPQDGSGPPAQLTEGDNTWKCRPFWSPDSKKLLWADSHRRLQYVDIGSKRTTTVACSPSWEFSDYTWSPDSRWIAYARMERQCISSIQLYSVEEKRTIAVTDGCFSSGEPVFSVDGKYLFFLAARPFTPLCGRTGWDHMCAEVSSICLVTLLKETASPFEPKSEDVETEEGRKGGDKKNGQKKKVPRAGKNRKSVATVRVDADGLQQRIAVLPISAASYRNLHSVSVKLFYIREGVREERSKLLVYNFAKQRETDLGDVIGFEISADGKKMIVCAENTYAILDLPGSKISMKKHLCLSDMNVVLDRHAEWNQIFAETWRLIRDILRAPSMHGADWFALRKKYETLLQYVNHRADLTYIIGEMIGEPGVGHVRIRGGDSAKPDRVLTGLLGAQFERDRATGYFRITGILKGQNRDKALRSPLTEIGVDVNEGDYLMAVDGRPTNKMKDVYEALLNTVGKRIILKVSATPEEAGSRSAVVVPTGDERPLYYYAWVQKNVSKVDRATGKRVGYMHIPDMEFSALNEPATYVPPQFVREGWIVDIRGNGSGTGAIISNPGCVVPGPGVLLLNEFSERGGDIPAYRGKSYTFGPVVRSLPLLDGGTLEWPVSSPYDVERNEWTTEGHRADPDIVVDNDPALEFAGIDEQLNKAIDLVNAELNKSPDRRR
jgi:tricorn protease